MDWIVLLLGITLAVGNFLMFYAALNVGKTHTATISAALLSTLLFYITYSATQLLGLVNAYTATELLVPSLAVFLVYWIFSGSQPRKSPPTP